jgi:dienelactone hydrolase
MGQSCGGMQALSASTDSRTTTTIVLNSGRFARDMKGPTGGQFSEWFEWSELHAPIAFFNGGPKDVQVAHQNFAEITSLPVFLADLPVGHTGAYPGPDMRWVKAVVGWLDWQLKGDTTTRAMFVGPKCGLCTDLDWTVTGSKNLPSQQPQGQTAPALAPAASSTGGDVWLAPPGTSISINRSTGVVSAVLPTQPVDGSREEFARFDNWRKHPYPGTGLYPATREENDTLPTHTLYYPADPGKVPGKMPIILWANGGCRNTSVEFTRFLGEIASNGYFIAAIGRSDIPFRVTDDLVVGERKAGDTRPLQNESPTDMLKGLDYAVAENGRQGSKFFSKIDTTKIAVVGQSCGGLQAFNAARDSRVTAAVAVNSHFHSRKHTSRTSMSLRPTWAAYADWFVEDLKIPAAYFTGGPADSAYNNAEISYRETSGAQPTVKVDMPLMGHTGAYPMPDVRWTNAVLSWLDFILKNDPNGKAMFAGEKCGLCSDPDFWVKIKGLK